MGVEERNERNEASLIIVIVAPPLCFVWRMRGWEDERQSEVEFGIWQWRSYSLGEEKGTDSSSTWWWVVRRNSEEP